MIEATKWVLALREPDSAMIRAATKHVEQCGDDDTCDLAMVVSGYRAMLSAAPEPPDVVGVLEDLLEGLSFGPLEFAAKYGPDFNGDEFLIETTERARALLDQLRGK